ncbi:unnamed protein product [Prorocentrum cordatum]|uniref:RRM domain-containing protein n=1 Tax=Prorocentrum cordatum TaxID=2364126 RepID=A0ABN9W4D9_9DINO|nr:unnamed protein product [Polarella glacialis]CAK0880964.1 unnamed protein product [Polarella glacialis]
MALALAEHRLALLGGKCQVFGEQPCAAKRSRSYSGCSRPLAKSGQSRERRAPTDPEGRGRGRGPCTCVHRASSMRCVPKHLLLSLDGLAAMRGSERRAPSPGAAACAAVAAGDGSTLAPEGSTSQAPGCAELAGGPREESVPEPWPGTESDTEEDASVVSSDGSTLAPGGLASEARGGAERAGAPREESDTEPLWDTESDTEALWCAPRDRGLAVAPGALLGAAAPRGAAVPPAQPAAPACGGQGPAAARGVLAGAVARAEGGADGLQPAVRVAASALEAAEAGSAERGRGCARAGEADATEGARAGRGGGGGGGGGAGRQGGGEQQGGEGAQAGRGLAAFQMRQSLLPRGVTTLMLRNLPPEVSQRILLEEVLQVHNSGFAGRVDFCYVPHDFVSGRNRGIALLNFTSHKAAAEFHRAWHGRLEFAGRAAGAAGIDISVAAVQGLAAILALSQRWAGADSGLVRLTNL